MNEVERFVLSHLSLAISAHNSQPFTIHFESSKRWILKADSGRALPAADPHGKDHEMTAGAYIELIDILLGTHGLYIEEWKKMDHDVELAVSAVSVSTRDEVRELAKNRLEMAKKRFSFRGLAAKKTELSLPKESSIYKYVADGSVIDRVARLYDSINYRYLVSPGYIEELYSWMRFKKSDPNFYLDGLNTQAMGPRSSRTCSSTARPASRSAWRRIFLLTTSARSSRRSSRCQRTASSSTWR